MVANPKMFAQVYGLMPKELLIVLYTKYVNMSKTTISDTKVHNVKRRELLPNGIEINPSLNDGCQTKAYSEVALINVRQIIMT